MGFLKIKPQLFKSSIILLLLVGCSSPTTPSFSEEMLIGVWKNTVASFNGRDDASLKFAKTIEIRSSNEYKAWTSEQNDTITGTWKLLTSGHNSTLIFDNRDTFLISPKSTVASLFFSRTDTSFKNFVAVWEYRFIKK